jgi:hypothetical protein
MSPCEHVLNRYHFHEGYELIEVALVLIVLANLLLEIHLPHPFTTRYTTCLIQRLPLFMTYGESNTDALNFFHCNEQDVRLSFSQYLNDGLKTTNLSQLKLFSIHTSKTHFPPCFGAVCFMGSFHCSLELE